MRPLHRFGFCLAVLLAGHLIEDHLGWVWFWATLLVQAAVPSGRLRLAALALCVGSALVLGGPGVVFGH